MEDPVAEVQEFEYILENVAMDEEGNADYEDAEGGGDVYDSITVTKKTHTVGNLKDICKALSLNTGGNKAAIFVWIRDCGSTLIVPIDAESFVFKKIRGGEADLSLPRAILNPEPAPDIPGIDMLQGAEMGFYGPTNVEGVEGAPKHQYCCSEEEKVHRPESASKKNPDRPTSEKGHILEAARKLLPDDCRMKSMTAVQKTSLTHRSRRKLCRGASPTPQMHEQQPRAPDLAGPSTTTTSPLIWKRSTR